MASQKAGFKFKRGVTVGSVVAETDREALRDAFQDNGFLSILRNTADPRSVIVGSTGVGKTALLIKLEEMEERVIKISPSALSLKYLSNSTIIPQLAASGVALQPFYELLWRLMLIAELLKRHFGLDEGIGVNLWTRLANLFASSKRQEKKKRALAYFRQFAPEFWEEAETLVRGTVQHFENRMKAEGALQLAPVSLATSGETAAAHTITEEQRSRLQRIVVEASVEHINTGLEIVRDNVLTDSQKRYFFIIDDLDRDWVELDYAYDLLDALLAAVADFAAMPNVKVVVALRRNIVAALHSDRRKQRQQREKHQNLFLPLTWSKHELIEMMDRRLRKFVRSPYSGDLTLEHLLPPSRKNLPENAVDYVLRRTFMRPRDVIDFINRCLEQAAEKKSSRISWATVEAAERGYSLQRLDSIRDEWADNYSGLEIALRVLEELPPRLDLRELELQQPLEPLLLQGEQEIQSGDAALEPLSLPRTAYELWGRGGAIGAWLFLMQVLYRVGAVGVKPSPSDPVYYSYERPLTDVPAFDETTPFYVHPALHCALRTQTRALTETG